MKDRNRKKIAKRKRQEVLEILDLAMRKNEGKGSVFFSFSGHVNLISVDIHKDGWPTPASQHMEKTLDRNFRGETSLREMKKALEVL